MGRPTTLVSFFAVLPVNFSPGLRVNSEQALPGFFDRNGMLGRKLVTARFVLIRLTVMF